MMKYTSKLILVSGLALIIGTSCAPPDNAPDVEMNNGDDWETLELRTQYEAIQVERLAVAENPWSIEFLPDGNYLVTERPGRLQLLDSEGNLTEISGVPEVQATGQGGLLEVSIHPDFENNQFVYLTYSKPNGGDETATALARGQLDGNELVDVEDIFIQDRYSGPGRHYGSRLAWTNDGYLLMSIGDRGADPPRAQDNMDHAGTLLRLNDDGSVPADNPFVGDDSALDEIYSYGHRNIQGLVVNPENDEIWATEHGPRGGDELNYIEPGVNYGWPTATLGYDYRTEEKYEFTEARRVEGMEDPFYEFLPTLAPSGLALVTQDRFEAWQGNLLAGGLRAERIRRVVYNHEEVLHEEELLLQEIGRIRDVREAPGGNIYVLTDHEDGGVYRIEPGE